MAAIVIAWRVIESQAAGGHRNRGFIAAGSLSVDVADTLAGAVHVPGPRVSGIDLKASIKAPIQPQLHGVIRRVALAGANHPRSKIRMKILVVELTWIGIGPGR
jgi:hypothetical protein